LIEEELKGNAAVDEYLNGTISDKELMDRYFKSVKGNIENSGKTVYIMDGKCYGNDADRFIDALEPTKLEQFALREILGKLREPVMISDATPNRLLERYWDKYGKEVVSKIVGNEMAGKLMTDDPPSTILERAGNHAREMEILSKLPRYGSLPPIAKFADEVVRMYKTKGEKEAVKVIGNAKGTKMKSIGCAFLFAIHHKGEEWKYSEMEMEFAEFLKKYVEKLLESEGSEYHEALKELVSVSGAMEKI
jgi:hypothetical protein